MSVRIVDCEQRTTGWYQARAGRLTGSVADVVMTAGKGGKESVQRRDLRLLLALERITGIADEPDGWLSKDVQRGIEKEPDAIARYEAETGLIVRRTGFIQHLGLPIGCSLDGDANDLHIIQELKSPKSATHVRYIREGKLPADYQWQCAHNLWVSCAKELHFVSFDDRLPDGLQFFMVVVTPESVEMTRYVAEATKFLAEVKVEVDQLQALMQQKAA